jgi:hypothetical protein
MVIEGNKLMGYDGVINGDYVKQITASCRAIEVKTSDQFVVGGFHLMMGTDRVVSYERPLMYAILMRHSQINPKRRDENLIFSVNRFTKWRLVFD